MGEIAVLNDRYVGARRRRREGRLGHGDIVGVDEVRYGPPRDVVLRMAEERGPGGVDRAETAIGFDHDEKVAREVPDAVALGGAFLDPPFEPFVRGLDRGEQTRILDRHRRLRS